MVFRRHCRGLLQSAGRAQEAGIRCSAVACLNHQYQCSPPSDSSRPRQPSWTSQASRCGQWSLPRFRIAPKCCMFLHHCCCMSLPIVNDILDKHTAANPKRLQLQGATAKPAFIIDDQTLLASANRGQALVMKVESMTPSIATPIARSSLQARKTSRTYH